MLSIICQAKLGRSPTLKPLDIGSLAWAPYNTVNRTTVIFMTTMQRRPSIIRRSAENSVYEMGRKPQHD